MKYAENTGISFIAWSPMGKGLLTNKYLDSKTGGLGDRLFDEGGIEKIITEETSQKLYNLSVIADELHVELSQLVIAYMLKLPGMGPVIPSSSNLKQLESNAAAAQIQLNVDQMARILHAVE